jgi:rod shape-determining protein MreC
MRFRVSKSILILFVVLFGILILHYSGVLSPIEGLVVKILRPAGSGIYRFGQKMQFLWKPNISKEDYLNLQKERNELAVKNAELQILEQENQELRTALNFTKENQYKFLIANIIGRDTLASNYFILNRGEKDGIKNNLPVISPEGVLVGKIIKTEQNISVMLIPIDTNFETAGSILGKSKKNTSGLVRGEKGLGIKMEFIPQDEEIEKDDIVITSGLELNMPKGLIIGKITEIKKEERDIFGEATISPMLSFDDLNVVTVILPNF